MNAGGAGKSREERITALLDLLRTGEKGELEELFALLYDELHQLAHRQRQRLAPQQTLNTTAVIHEACLNEPIPPRAGSARRRARCI